LVELMLSLLLLGVASVVWSLRDNNNPAALWAWGWALLASARIFLLFGDEAAWSPGMSVLLSPLLPAFMLAGALCYADREHPRWLLPAALGLGVLRWGLVRVGWTPLNDFVGLVVEPAAELGAAWLMIQATRAPGQRIAPRLVGPALALLAVLEVMTAWQMSTLGATTPRVGGLWWPFGVVTLGLQITAAGHRQREIRLSLQEQGDLARRALVASERRFEVLARHASDLIAEFGEGGRITYVSPSVSHILGWPPDELVGGTDFDWVHPEDREVTLRRVREAADSEGACLAVFRARTTGGQWCWLEADVVGFVASSGDRRAVAICRDVSERRARHESLQRAHDSLEERVAERTSQLRRVVTDLESEVAARQNAEGELRTSRERYRIVSELSSDYSFGLLVASDGSSHAEWATDAFEKVTGYTVNEANVIGWRTVIRDDHFARANDLLVRALTGEIVEFDGEVATKAGERRWLRTRLVAAPVNGEGTIRVMGASSDITEQRRVEGERRALEAHLSEVQRLESLGVLAGGIAHDFNNLLSVILGNASLGMRDAPPESELAQRLARIRSAAQHGAELTGQMLTYSGKTPFSLIPTDLSRVVEQTRDLLEASIARKGTLRLDVTAGVPLVDGDEAQLRQVIVNLVNNAAEAVGDAGGTVRVSTGVEKVGPAELALSIGGADAQPGEYIVLTVEDTGPGMDDATKDRIFDPFFTTRRAGRGLGLPAVLGIVRGHDGAIVLESRPGEGTRFRVLLRRSERTHESVRRPPSAAPSARPKGAVLVVDDEQDVLEIASEFLKRAGFQVKAALGGREAVAILERDPGSIDAIVLDLVMPDLDGEQTLGLLREIAPSVPVILTSGYDEERASHRFAPDQVLAFLRKPYAPEQLIEKVEEALAT
jgi:two-component system cell cycle sensor histidine kinase/response regulator CckA